MGEYDQLCERGSWKRKLKFFDQYPHLFTFVVNYMSLLVFILTVIVNLKLL